MTASAVHGHLDVGRPSVVFAVFCALFWGLRLYYWSHNVEAPFSDMADYVEAADNIRRSFTFGLPQHPTFLTPVTPSLIAITKLVSAAHFHAVFQFVTQLLVFVGVLALAREIRLLTGHAFLAFTLCGIVAMCRPSIFWSFKVATEPVCEGLLYLTSALVLATLRTQRCSLSFAAGACCLLLGLNRPNYLPGISLVFVAILVRTGAGRLPRPDRADSGRGQRLFGPTSRVRRVALPAMFLCGVLALWWPWIARNYVNYGVFLPTASSGYLALVSEQGAGPLRAGRYRSLTLADGSEFSNFGIMNVIQAWKSLPTPAERLRFLRMLASAWLAENWTDIPRAMVWRLRHMLSSRSADGLTKLSREELFQSRRTGVQSPVLDAAWINVLLLDKTPTVVLLSLVGLTYLLVRFPCVGLAFTGLLFVPWLGAAAVIALSRSVESLVAFDTWLAFFAVACFVADMLGKPIGPATAPAAREPFPNLRP